MSHKNITLRRRLMRMHNLGWKPKRISRTLKISHQRVSQLLAELEADGIEGFIQPEDRRTGKHSLASEARGVLEETLSKEPWTGGFWSVADLLPVLAEHEIELSERHVHQIVSRMGYRLVWVHLPTHLKESA